MIEIRCAECDVIFKKNREWQRFCTPVCRTKHFLRVKNADAAIGRKIRKSQNDVAQPNRVHRDLFAA